MAGEPRRVAAVVTCDSLHGCRLLRVGRDLAALLRIRRRAGQRSRVVAERDYEPSFLTS